MRQSDAFTQIPMRSTVLAMHTSSRALRLARLGLLSIAASAVLYNASCSSGGQTGTSSGEEENEHPELADVIYQGEVTDEALVDLLAKKATDNNARSPSVDSPTDSGTLPAATTPNFSWHIGGGGGGTGGGGGGGAGGGDGGAAIQTTPSFRFAQFAKPTRTTSASSALTPLAELLGPVRAASAHGAPFNATGYWLVFATDANPKLLRVFTDKASYQPDANAWKKLQEAGKPITLTIVAGWFDNNTISTDGGPFAGKPVTFTVTP